MTTGELIGRIYDLSTNKLMRMAVDIKEYPKRSAFRYHDFPAVKAAFEKVLDIRGPERQRVRDYYYCKARYGEIKNDAGLRMAYEMLGILKELGGRREGMEISIKRAIRKYSQRPSTWAIRRIVKDEGIDGYTELIMLPAFDTLERAEVFFRDRHYIEATPSAYDCTGRCFTVWYKLFQRRGNWWAYHRVAMDV